MVDIHDSVAEKYTKWTTDCFLPEELLSGRNGTDMVSGGASDGRYGFLLNVEMRDCFFTVRAGHVLANQVISRKRDES